MGLRKIYIKSVLLILSVQFSNLAFPQADKAINPWVSYEISEQEDNYEISYTFKDHLENLQNFTLLMPVKNTQNAIDKFGVPNWLFEPYIDNEYNKHIREEEMEKGLFRLHGDVIEVDKSKAIDFYKESYGKPIARMIVQSLASVNRDTRLDRIEMTIRFVQDIPYGIPLYNDENWHYGGVNVPPKLLQEGMGDCDSKALLFVSILVYLIPADDIIFLNQKDHLLTAIKAKPSKGDTYVHYKMEKYLIAETAGPGRRKLGEKGSYYRTKFQIEPLDIIQPEIFEFEKTNDLLASNNNAAIKKDAASNTILLVNNNKNYFKFQISTNGEDWDKLQLKPNQTGKYVFNSPTELFLRYKAHNYTYESLEVKTGNQYQVIFDASRNKWAIRK